MPKGEIVGIMIYLSLVTTLIQLWMLTELITQHSVYRAFSGYQAVQCILSIQQLPSSTVYTEHSTVTKQYSVYRVVQCIPSSSVFTEKMGRSAVFTEFTVLTELSDSFYVYRVDKGNSVYRVNEGSSVYRVNKVITGKQCLPSDQGKWRNLVSTESSVITK